jgi:hypothetical protein
MYPTPSLLRAIRPSVAASIRCLAQSLGLIERALILIGVPEAMYQSLRIGAIVFVPQLVQIAGQLLGLRAFRGVPRPVFLPRPAVMMRTLHLLGAGLLLVARLSLLLLLLGMFLCRLAMTRVTQAGRPRSSEGLEFDAAAVRGSPFMKGITNRNCHLYEGEDR